MESVSIHTPIYDPSTTPPPSEQEPAYPPLHEIEFDTSMFDRPPPSPLRAALLARRAAAVRALRAQARAQPRMDDDSDSTSTTSPSTVAAAKRALRAVRANNRVAYMRELYFWQAGRLHAAEALRPLWVEACQERVTAQAQKEWEELARLCEEAQTERALSLGRKERRREEREMRRAERAEARAVEMMLGV